MTDDTITEFTAYDLESTGLKIGEDRIVEFGATIFKDKRITGRGRFLVNPGIPIAPDARAVHGISDERVAGCPSFEELLPRIQRHFESCPVLVGYNNKRFDDRMLNAEAARVGSSWCVPSDKVLDLMVFVNWYHRGSNPRTQVAIGEIYNVRPTEGAAHAAAVDTQMTGELLLALIDAGVVPETLEAAIAEQSRLAPIIEAEYEEWGPWLYRDRKTQRLRIGAGKHCGKYLIDTPKGTIGWYLNNIKDLPEQTRAAFESAKAGKTHDEIQESMFKASGKKAETAVDDVAGWGG